MQSPTFRLNNYPVIKTSVLFIAGILIQYYFRLELGILIYFLVSFLAIGFVSLFFIKNKTIQVTLSQLIFIPIILFGSLTFYVNNLEEVKPPLDQYRVKNIKLSGEVGSIDLINENGFRFLLKTYSILSADTVIRKEYTFQLTVKEKSKKKLLALYENVYPGNFISVEGDYRKGKEARNPGEFDYNRYLQQRGISATVVVDDVNKVKILDKNKNFLKSGIFEIRKYIAGNLDKLHEEYTAGLLKGLLLADRSDISEETKTMFINSGVIHVLAVSGLHVGFIAVIFLFLFGRFNVKLKIFLTSAGLLFFLFLTGSPPSVFRATIMALALLFAYLTNRDTNGINSLFLAAFIILIFNPNDLFHPGFQLSFAAVLSILLVNPFFSRIIDERVKSNPAKNIFLFFGVSLSAQLGTLPLTIIYFGKVSVIALIANLIVIPLVALIVSNGIFTIILSTISFTAASTFANASDALTNILFYFVDFAGSLSFSHLRVTQFTLIQLFIFYFFFIFLLYYLNAFSRILSKSLLICLVIANTFLFVSLNDSKLLPDGKLSVLMIDVGQGDATLVKFPDGTTYLIDAGDVLFSYDSGERVIIPLLNYLNIEQVDAGIISHMDTDHYGGFVSLVEKGRVKKIIKPSFDSNLVRDVKFEKYLKEKRIETSYFSETGDSIGNTRIYYLNDLSKNEFQNYRVNDKSGCFLIIHGENEFLFTGDIEKRMETYLVSKYPQFLEADVLKVPHHGSNTSSSVTFIAIVRPKISLISAGIQNRFKHPSMQVVERINNSGSEVFRTDIEGAILLISDGKNVAKVKW